MKSRFNKAGGIFLGLTVIAAIAFGIYFVVRPASDGASKPGNSSDCNPVQRIELAGQPDPIELATMVFPCAEDAFVVPATASGAETRTAVAAAIENKKPLFVRSDTNEEKISSALEKINANETVAPAGSADLDIKALASMFDNNAADSTYVLPSEPSTDQLALLPSLHASGLRVAFAQPGDASTLAELAGNNTSYTFSDDFDETDRWRSSITEELPGGGYSLFPDRRIVAFYGHPTTTALGLLGEQGPEESVERLKAKTPQYDIDGIPTIGGFEIITTIATAEPTPEGNYTRSTDPEVLRPWIEVATENDLYVILDLQPGRVDFLTQAKEYEEFLKLPNVGLALDPEWRLEADEVHLRQIGTVDAAEVNTVVDYLAGLVRENNLPQKALVLHQFQVRMLEDRAEIKTPAELAVAVHVDGQGPLGTKYGTYDTMLDDPIGPDQTLWWGWKNFIDEDTPTATPEQVNAVDPLPSIVTYQ